MSDYRHVQLVSIYERFLHKVVTLHIKLAGKFNMFHRSNELTISSYQMINSL